MSTRQSSGRDGFSVSVVPNGEVVTVAPVGDLDLATADQVAEAVGELRTAGFRDVVIDLRSVPFIDSKGVQMLIVLRNEAHQDGHRLSLRPPSASTRRVFELTGTSGLFDWLEPGPGDPPPVQG